MASCQVSALDQSLILPSWNFCSAELLFTEGVQLLCLIDKGLDACRYLQTYGRWYQAAWLAKVSSHWELWLPRLVTLQLIVVLISGHAELCWVHRSHEKVGRSPDTTSSQSEGEVFLLCSIQMVDSPVPSFCRAMRSWFSCPLVMWTKSLSCWLPCDTLIWLLFSLKLLRSLDCSNQMRKPVSFASFRI